jgi:excisionase family DNA binding protein
LNGFDIVLNGLTCDRRDSMSQPFAMKPENSNQALALFTAKEAAEYLRISISTLNRMEHKGAVTSLRTPGGHRRYTLEMLNACLRTWNGQVE